MNNFPPDAKDLAGQLIDGREERGVELRLGQSTEAKATIIATHINQDGKQDTAFRVTIERTMPIASANVEKPSLRCPICNSILRICGDQDTDPAWHTIECTNVQCPAQWDSNGDVGW